MSSYIICLEPTEHYAPHCSQSSPTQKAASTAAVSTLDDDFDFCRARECAAQLQADYLAWQIATQERKGKAGAHTAHEYDAWEKDERASLSKDMNDNERRHFDYFADVYDSVHRPWAQKYEEAQRRKYAIDTHKGVLSNNKAMLAANVHDDDFVADCVGQIIVASNELGRLQNFGEKECATLRVENVNDAMKAALQGKIDSENVDEAMPLYKRREHLLDVAHRAEMQEYIMGLHHRAQTKKAMDCACQTLLHMDDEAAAAHLTDATWLQSMNISEALLPELTEYSAAQRHNMQREKKKSQDKRELEWLDTVLTTHGQDPPAALRMVQEREGLEPELRQGMIHAISNGRIDTMDDTATMLALQDRMFGGEEPLERKDFAREISKGNIRVESAKELLTLQHYMNKGEKKLVSNALSVLDASFAGVEDFTENPSRLAARMFYVRCLTKAIRENDMQQLVMLTKKEQAQAVGNSFAGR